MKSNGKHKGSYTLHVRLEIDGRWIEADLHGEERTKKFLRYVWERNKTFREFLITLISDFINSDNPDDIEAWLKETAIKRW